MEAERTTCVLSPHRCLDRKSASKVLDLLCELPPSSLPEFYNIYEPVNVQFSCDDRAQVVQRIQSGNNTFFWRKKGSRVSGSVFSAFGARQVHSTFKLRQRRDFDTDVQLQFLKSFAIELDAHFGCVNVITPSDDDLGKANETVGLMDPKTGESLFAISSFCIQKYIPDLYWGTVLGRPYIDLFGVDTLLSSPAHLVEQWTDDLLYIQLTPNADDADHNLDEFLTIRDRCKAHLGCRAFFEYEKGTEHKYRIPEFNLPPGDPVPED